MLELNDEAVIQNFMNLLSEEEQNRVCKDYLEKENVHALFNLAITTNVKNTYMVIEVLIKEHPHLIMPLVSKLKKVYLDYALDKIIKEKGSNYYLNLIYAFINENNNIYLKLINFIFDFKYENLFTKESLKKLNNYWQNIEKNPSLKK